MWSASASTARCVFAARSCAREALTTEVGCTSKAANNLTWESLLLICVPSALYNDDKDNAITADNNLALKSLRFIGTPSALCNEDKNDVINVCSFNVTTLHPGLDNRAYNRCKAVPLVSRVALLEKALASRKVLVAGIQESRSKHTRVRAGNSYDIYEAAASDAGN